MSEKQRLVVIGNGMAGARAVEEILACGGGEQFAITMFGAEPYGNYNRIMLSDVLNGNQSREQIFLNPLAWYAEHNITLHAGTPVADIDRAAREVVTRQGLRVPYDILILATGSHAFVPPMDNLYDSAGHLKQGVFVFRTLDDCQQIASYAQRSKRAAVIGGGLLGLEAARGLLSYGCEVHVIQRGSSLMNQQLDSESGALLEAAMEALGVHVHCDTLTSGIVGNGHVTGLTFTDGSQLACDMLVIAAGIKPNVDLALGCGLSVERGIVVTNLMRSIDDRQIYAVGECAQHHDMVYGLVAPIWEQVRVLADHLTRRNVDAAYHGSKLATKLKVMGVDLASMGRVEAQDEQDEVVLYSEPKRGIYKKVVIRDDRVIGAILLGDTGRAAYLLQAFDRNTPLPEERAALLFDIGAGARQESLQDLSDDTQICNCNGVSKGAIRQCIANGNRSPKAVMAATRAGMGCGSCKSRVQELVTLLCAGDVEEDSVIQHSVVDVPLPTPNRVQTIHERGLKAA
ncbi:MAG TPA: FAD-dependent oxidoreductase [Roseiflexaceae bacterium]|nr:FAD-dependent oxidoreductase [Roseiflexaceae bacterium]